MIQVVITNHKGNKVKYERYNDGLRYKLDVPYTQEWRSAKFRLESGKPKNEVFHKDETDERIMEFLRKKYSNLEFELEQSL